MVGVLSNSCSMSRRLCGEIVPDNYFTNIDTISFTGYLYHFNDPNGISILVKDDKISSKKKMIRMLKERHSAIFCYRMLYNDFMNLPKEDSIPNKKIERSIEIANSNIRVEKISGDFILSLASTIKLNQEVSLSHDYQFKKNYYVFVMTPL